LFFLLFPKTTPKQPLLTPFSAEQFQHNASPNPCQPRRSSQSLHETLKKAQNLLLNPFPLIPPLCPQELFLVVWAQRSRAPPKNSVFEPVLYFRKFTGLPIN